MTEDLDIEAMLEEPYRKERENKNGIRSESDSDSDTGSSRKRHKKRSRKSRSRSREKTASKRNRSGSREKRRRSRSRSHERKPRPEQYGRRRRSRSRSRSRERRRATPVHKPRGGPPHVERGGRDRERDRDTGAPHVTSLLTARQREKMIEEENISQEERDARTVFIMQLARNITIRDIEEFFSKVGQVRDVRLISDRNSRRSKGIGYVEFTDKTAVPLAINLSGERLLGVPIMCQPTMAEKNRAAATAQNLSKPQGPTRLYVGSLHYNISEQMLKAIFEPFGFVDNVQLIYDTETSRSKGYGFVTFKDPDAAKRALDQLNGFELAGRPMKVGHVTERSDGSMSFLDDEETEKGGIEMNAASRAALMQKLAATHAVGMQVPSAPMVPAVLQTPLLQQQPSPCVLLSNMFDPAKETDPGWDDDIKNDVLEEISKYGSLVHVHVDRISSEGNVYMKCSSSDTASTLRQTFNGRWFAGRTLKAALIPLHNYHTLFPQSQVATVTLRSVQR